MNEGRILVIDDNPVNVELCSELLGFAGFEVIAATTAEQGVSLAKAAWPDLILMDVSLPGMDGLQATRVLRSDPATKGLTIVALTAHAMKGDDELARKAGCDGYLTKPIDTRTFVERIRGFLRAPQVQTPPR